MSADAVDRPGRYQIVALGEGGAVMIDTATGSTWSLARDPDTLRLSWHRVPESISPALAVGPQRRERGWKAALADTLR